MAMGRALSLLLLSIAGCGRVPTLEDCRTRGAPEFELVGLPCDGPDVDLCAEGVWECSPLGELSCTDATNDAREICNGVDDDCDGLTDPGCGCLALPPPDCDPDGDGLPPRACAEPTLSGAETIACVCAAAPCADLRCQTSHTDVQTALDALAPLGAPTELWLFAGTYDGFTVEELGSDATRPLRITAHCAAGERAAVIVRSTVELKSSNVTLEGMRVDLGAQLAAGVRVHDTPALRTEQVSLRALTITGDALSTAEDHAYVFLRPYHNSDLGALTVEEVDIYGGANGSRRHGMMLDHVAGVVVQDSSFCRLDTPAEDIGLRILGTGVLVSRSLTRAVDVGFSLADGDYLVDEVLATGCRAHGIRTDGYNGTIKNSRLLANGNGLDAMDGVGLVVFNSLFAGNAGYGAWHHRTDGCCGTLGAFWYNTFAENGVAGLVLEGLLDREIWEVSFNLFAGQSSPGAVGLRTVNYAIVTSVGNLFHDNQATCACSGADCGSATDCQNDTPLLTGAPAFVDGPGGWRYLLAQPPEQPIASAALDASSEAAAAACVAGTCLGARTTSTTTAVDGGQADLGFHYPVCP